MYSLDAYARPWIAELLVMARMYIRVCNGQYVHSYIEHIHIHIIHSYIYIYMRVYMSIRAYIIRAYIQIRAYIHEHIHTYIIHSYIYIYISTYIYIYMRVYIEPRQLPALMDSGVARHGTYMNTCVHWYIHAYIHIHICAHAYIPIHMHTYIHTYAYTHLHIYSLHTYTRPWMVELLVTATSRLSRTLRFTLFIGRNSQKSAPC